MSVTRIGLSSEDVTSRVFDPELGIQTQVLREGSEDDMNAQALTWTNQYKAKCRVDQLDGPVYRLTALFGDAQDGTEVIFDVWERVTEYVQEDLRNNPNLIAAVGSISALVALVKVIKDALKQGVDISEMPGYEDVGPDEPARLIFDLYARGAEATEIKRFVLRVRRTYSLTYADRAVVSATETIYSTSGLISVFGVPSLTAATLPDNPAFAPTGTAWGWKQRQCNQVQVPALNKVEETLDWVFAAWSTLQYDHV